MAQTQPSATGETYDAGGWSQDDPSKVPPGTPQPTPGASPLAPQSPMASQADIGEMEATKIGAELPYQEKLLKVLNSPQEATAHLDKVQNAPNPQDFKKYSFEFASAMAVIGAISGRWTRHAGNASLNAFTGALNGWHQGNLEAYEQASKQWEQATKHTIENNNVELEKYHEIMQDKQANIDQMMAAMQIAGAEAQNKVIMDLAGQKNFTAVFQAVDKMQIANQRLQGAYGQLSDVRAEQQATVAGQVDYLNAHPEQIASMKLEDFLKLKGTAQTLGLKLNDPPPGTAFAGSPPDLGNPQQPPPNVQQKDWDIWADYERYTGKAPNLGWGAQMNAFKAKLSLYANERQSQGVPIDPAALTMANQQANYAGTVSGAKSIGTRAANVDMAANLATVAIPQALEASAAFPRGQWTPVNAVKLKAYEAGSSVPLSKWDIANLQIAEMYARALNPQGYTIRKDMMDRAISVISEAKSPEAYKATLDSIQEAMQREKAGIAKTRQDQLGIAPGGDDAYTPASGGDTAPPNNEGWGDVTVH